MTVIDDLIALDVTTIVVTRHTKVPNAGGFSWTTANLDPIDVRIFQVSPRHQSEYTMPEGEVKQIDHGILAPAGTDFRTGHDSYDTFTLNGRTMRIISTRTVTEANLDPHVQAYCVAV